MLLAILVREGETVPVESVVAVIGAAGEAVDDAAGGRQRPTPALAQAPSAQPARAAADGNGPPASGAERRHAGRDLPGRRRKSSPLVRRIAHDQGVDVGGRVGHGHRAAA